MKKTNLQRKVVQRDDLDEQSEFESEEFPSSEQLKEDDFERIQTSMLNQTLDNQESIKFFNKDLNWFDIETRIRSIVVDVTYPLNAAFNALKESNFQVKALTEKLKAKSEEQSLTIYKTHKKCQMIDEVQTKVKSNHESSRITAENLEIRIHRLEEDFEVAKLKHTKLNELIDNQNDKFDEIKKKIPDVYLKIDQEKAILDSKILVGKRNMYDYINNVIVDVKHNLSQITDMKSLIANTNTTFRKYDVIVQDYVNRTDYLQINLERVENEKLGKDMLNKKVLDLKRFVQNTQVKILKMCGISDQLWNNGVTQDTPTVDYETQRPLSFRNEKLLSHITITNFLRSTLKKKSEFVSLHSHSVRQYQILGYEEPTDPDSIEEKQRHNYLEIIHNINQQLLEESEAMKDDKLDFVSTSGKINTRKALKTNSERFKNKVHKMKELDQDEFEAKESLTSSHLRSKIQFSDDSISNNVMSAEVRNTSKNQRKKLLRKRTDGIFTR